MDSSSLNTPPPSGRKRTKTTNESEMWGSSSSPSQFNYGQVGNSFNPSHGNELAGSYDAAYSQQPLNKSQSFTNESFVDPAVFSKKKLTVSPIPKPKGDAMVGARAYDQHLQHAEQEKRLRRTSQSSFNSPSPRKRKEPTLEIDENHRASVQSITSPMKRVDLMPSAMPPPPPSQPHFGESSAQAAIAQIRAGKHPPPSARATITSPGVDSAPFDVQQVNDDPFTSSGPMATIETRSTFNGAVRCVCRGEEPNGMMIQW